MQKQNEQQKINWSLKNNLMKNIIWLLINFILITASQLIFTRFWWNFLPISIVTGIVCGYINVPVKAFGIAFISGFISWLGGTIYYHFNFAGDMLVKTGQMFLMPKWLFILFIGLLGGLLNGLAFYSGYAVAKQRIFDFSRYYSKN